MAKYRNEADRHADVTRMTEAMRDLNPEKFDEAAKVVRRNVENAKRYTPHLFVPKH